MISSINSISSKHARSGGKFVGQLRHFSVISMDIFEAKNWVGGDGI